MRRVAGLALTLSCIAVHIFAQPQETSDPRAGDGLQLPPQRRSHLERDPERFDFFGELREEQCQDDLDCDRNTGRVCARKPNDVAGHCQCPPEKPNKDAQGLCQPAEQPGCQQNADCGKPQLECVDRQCRCVAPNVAQADGRCGPAQEPPPTKSAWLSPLAFLFSILLLMTCTVFVTRYRKDEDALDEEEMSEAGTGGAAAASGRSWSGTKGAVTASSSSARVQPKTSPLGGAPSRRGSVVPRQPDDAPGSPQEASSASRVYQVPPSDSRAVSAASVSYAADAVRPSEESALQQSIRPSLGVQAFAAAKGTARTGDVTPPAGGSAAVLQGRTSSTPRPVKQVDRCASEDVQLPEFVRSPTQQGGDMGWPEMVPVQRIRRGLQLLGSSPGRNQLQHLLDGRDLFEREEEGAQVEPQLHPPLRHVPCSKTVQTDITLAPAIVPFAALDTALWPFAPSRCGGTAASKVSPLLTVDCGDAAGRSTGLEPGSSELFLTERHQKPVATKDAPLVHQSPTRVVGGRGGAGAAYAQEMAGHGFTSPGPLRVRASGEGPSCSSQQPQSELTRSDGPDSSAGTSFPLGGAGKTKSRFSMRHASSDELDGFSSEAATANDNKMASAAAASAARHGGMQPMEEASASVDPTSESPSELLGTVPRPQHPSVAAGETSSQGPDGWSTRLRTTAHDEDASVSFQSFDVEAQVIATESRTLVVERQVAVDVRLFPHAAPPSESQDQ